MRRQTRVLLLVSMVIVVVAVGAASWFAGHAKAASHPPLPNPNGYDDFVKAVALARVPKQDASTLDHEGLKTLLSQNAEALRVLRIGLSRDCVVPETGIANQNGVLDMMFSFGSLLSLLYLEGRLAEMEGRYGDAARSYVDAIRFGNDINSGRRVICYLTARSCESMGQLSLGAIIHHLGAGEARPLISELEDIDAARIMWDDIQKEGYQYALEKLRTDYNPIAYVASLWDNWRTVEADAVNYKRNIARTRLLTIELALHCHLLQHARPPATLDQLVPEYFQHLPLDPFSGKPPIYRVQGTNTVLYSVGGNGVDDGGQQEGVYAVRGVRTGDLFYNSRWQARFTARFSECPLHVAKGGGRRSIVPPRTSGRGVRGAWACILA